MQIHYFDQKGGTAWVGEKRGVEFRSSEVEENGGARFGMWELSSDGGE